MRYLIIELGKLHMRIAQAKRSKRKTVIHSVLSFPLPMTISEIKSLEQEKNFKTFVDQCVNSITTKKSQVCLILNGDLYFSKEFNHPPAKLAYRQKLANLEAEAIWQGKGNEYIVDSIQWGEKQNKDGMQYSILYAVNKDTLDLLSRLFNSNQLNLSQVIPQVYAFSRATHAIIKEPSIQAELGSNSIAVLGLGREFTRLVIYENGEFVHERLFPSVYSEIIDLYREELGLDSNVSEQLLYQKITLEDTIEIKKISDANQRVQVLVAAMLQEALQALQIVLSSERLQLEKVLIAGPLSQILGIDKYIEQVIHKPCEFITTYQKALINKITWLPLEYGMEHFMSLIGAILTNDHEDINLLKYYIKKKREIWSQRSLITATTLLMLIVFGALPFVYSIHAGIQAKYKKALDHPQYQEIKTTSNNLSALKQQQLEMTDEIIKLENLPHNINSVLISLQKEFQGAMTLNNFVIDAKSATITIDYTAASLQAYVDFKNKLNQEDKFTVLLPFNYNEEKDLEASGGTGTMILSFKEVNIIE